MAKMELDRHTKITPGDSVQFENSKIVRDTITFLGVVQEKHLEITQHRFSSTRDLLITELVIDNGHRAGVLANMTVGEYRDVELNNGSHTITVFKHKEARAEPIRVTMNDKLFGWMKVYMKKIRAALSKDMSLTAKVYFFYQYQMIKTQKWLHSTVPSKAGIDTRSSGPHFGQHLHFYYLIKQQNSRIQGSFVPKIQKSLKPLCEIHFGLYIERLNRFGTKLPDTTNNGRGRGRCCLLS